MEPDVKTLLTQRIREVEHEPVVWNKAAVWMNVQNHISTTSSRPAYYYYAAAGVTFLLFGSLFLWQKNQSSSVEVATAVKLPMESSVLQNHVAVESKAKERSVVNVAPFVKQGPSEITYVVRVEELLVMSPAQEEELTLPGEIVDEPSITLATPEEAILPIVGVIQGEEQKQVASTKTRRKKLRTLEPIDKTGTESAPNLILARIK